MIFKKHKYVWRLISVLILAFTVFTGCVDNFELNINTGYSGGESTAQFTDADETAQTPEEDPPEAEDEPQEDIVPEDEASPTPEPEQTEEPTEAPAEAEEAISENGEYTSKDDVALYIHTYNKLPANFISKKDAQALGWTGGSLEPYAPGKSIGGDRFGNYEGILPDGKYKECDIDTRGRKSRGAKRIVFDDKGNIYYTDDHYESFIQLY